MRALLAALLIPFVLATVIATAALWPEDRKQPVPEGLGNVAPLIDATIVRVTETSCANDPSTNRCSQTDLTLKEGENKGDSIVMEIPIGPGQPVVEEGDKIIVGEAKSPDGTLTYYFSDFQRQSQIAWLALAFTIFVILVARWRGIGALIGLVVAWLVITQFMLPAILEGKSPLLVAVAGSAVIVFLALYIAHGFNARTSVAVIGTLASLALTGVLASIAVSATHLTGLASEESTYVQSFAGNVDIRGLILGGIVLGGLGILNDMTISQSSAVREVHMAQPNLSRRQLYASGMRVGRDHIASTVYTLVLAYTGAALPLLILFTLSNRQFADVVATELVGEEVVRTLVGSLGLIASVPITTALSAWVEKSRPVFSDPHLATPDRGAPDRGWDDVEESIAQTSSGPVSQQVPVVPGPPPATHAPSTAPKARR